jgi:hypothetical protein
VAQAIEKAGGWVVGSYKEPLGGHPVLLTILPIDAVEPTPFQRDLSDAHHKRLADVINKTGRFLDPIIAVVAPKGSFWTAYDLQRAFLEIVCLLRKLRFGTRGIFVHQTTVDGKIQCREGQATGSGRDGRTTRRRGLGRGCYNLGSLVLVSVEPGTHLARGNRV